jgi:molybdopterin-guanine dinucleotide biosynthesis protein A
VTDAGFDAIVLAGGDARRLGGVDKPAQQVAGVPLLDRALAAVADARRIVVVGPRRAVTREVSWCREEPPGGGPVAAIAAALPQVRSDRVVVLAADLPWIAPAVAPLLAALEVRTAAVLIDGEGRRNVLAAAWRVGALRDAVAALGSPAGRAARTLYQGVTVAEVPDVGGWGADCDTWEDLHAARHRPAGDERSPT